MCFNKSNIRGSDRCSLLKRGFPPRAAIPLVSAASRHDNFGRTMHFRNISYYARKYVRPARGPNLGCYFDMSTLFHSATRALAATDSLAHCTQKYLTKPASLARPPQQHNSSAQVVAEYTAELVVC